MNKQVKIKEFIKKVTQNTEKKIIKWKSLSSLEYPNAKFASYIQNHIPSHKVYAISTGLYKPLFENMHLQVEGSLFAQHENGFIFLLYFYKPKQYTKMKNEQNIKNKTFNSIHIILGLQADINNEIVALNKHDEMQNDLMKLLDVAQKLDDKTDKYIDSIIGLK